MKLNSSGARPLYFQLKQMIKENINRGKYKPGQQLPTEAELCDEYGVSRITARRAILDLVEEGILFRQQGKGTFVSENKLKSELISVDGFSEFITGSGKIPNSQILSTSMASADEYAAKLLDVKEGAPLLMLHRLLYVNEEPFVIETSHYSLERFPNLEKYIGESTSTYSILKNRYNVKPTRNDRTIDVMFATEYEANLLKCTTGTILYKIEKITYDDDSNPIHISELLYQASKVKFTVSSDGRKNRLK